MAAARAASSYLIEVRGLKQKMTLVYGVATKVVPYRGAWIETSSMQRYSHSHTVASFADAWIETLFRL